MLFIINSFQTDPTIESTSVKDRTSTTRRTSATNRTSGDLQSKCRASSRKLQLSRPRQLAAAQNVQNRPKSSIRTAILSWTRVSKLLAATRLLREGYVINLVYVTWIFDVASSPLKNVARFRRVRLLAKTRLARLWLAETTTKIGGTLCGQATDSIPFLWWLFESQANSSVRTVPLFLKNLIRASIYHFKWSATFRGNKSWLKSSRK